MQYDIQMICQFCREIGFPARMDAGRHAQVDLGQGAILCFQNEEREEDSRIGFSGMSWHMHGDIMFADAHGNYTELDYLGLLSGLKEGLVLICEEEVNGRTKDRWLIHSKYNDELRFLQENERIIIRRAVIQSIPAGQKA